MLTVGFNKIPGEGGGRGRGGACAPTPLVFRDFCFLSLGPLFIHGHQVRMDVGVGVGEEGRVGEGVLSHRGLGEGGEREGGRQGGGGVTRDQIASTKV